MLRSLQISGEKGMNFLKVCACETLTSVTAETNLQIKSK